jgi:hypothetical protein
VRRGLAWLLVAATWSIPLWSAPPAMTLDGPDPRPELLRFVLLVGGGSTLSFLYLCWVRPFPISWPQPARFVNDGARVMFWVMGPPLLVVWSFLLWRLLRQWLLPAA